MCVSVCTSATQRVHLRNWRNGGGDLQPWWSPWTCSPLQGFNSCVICLTDGSRAWLNKGFPQHTYPSWGGFVCGGDIMVNSLPDIFRMRCHLAAHLSWHGNGAPARTCVCLLLILRMREKALIAGASFDPQQMKTKKHLSYLESPLLLSLSVSVSRLIPRLAAQTTCNIGQWGHWGCGGQWPPHVSAPRVKVRFITHSIFSFISLCEWTSAGLRRHRKGSDWDLFSAVWHFTFVCLCMTWSFNLNRKQLCWNSCQHTHLCVGFSVWGQATCFIPPCLLR